MVWEKFPNSLYMLTPVDRRNYNDDTIQDTRIIQNGFCCATTVRTDGTHPVSGPHSWSFLRVTGEIGCSFLLSWMIFFLWCGWTISFLVWMKLRCSFSSNHLNPPFLGSVQLATTNPCSLSLDPNLKSLTYSWRRPKRNGEGKRGLHLSTRVFQSGWH